MPQAGDRSAGRAEAPSLSIPDSNPWKAEFVEELENTSNAAVQSILADGVITDAENADVLGRFSQCLADFGLKRTQIDRYGSEKIEMADDEEHPDFQAEIDECDRSAGKSIIEPLYVFTRTNPDNEEGLDLQCLKKRGVVDPGLTLDQYNEKIFDWDYMNSLGKDYEECTIDPKGLLQ